ncbi:ABC transporter permease [Brenneria goodwinii]|uniref:ABC transporter permease n=1 Tax=Brenneria goodwinii TaxID=1109412 RepID=UPI000EF21649|nr:ABC transporter permease [Brenneria goodwinii]MCG8158911.1 ABC transporter permease [Brenneria goodwinii]MCG8162514.1 ABC transporter permease [Brenneria goodwinii]MCG8166555.1 ABC transporter permease [Brenneria goodwinii]MCG8170531.1 ABC transporter permease [Brenneria goodwinii]MCG8174469.1 ABC transporter permease [Brenneria goodwinii]
MNTIKPGLFSLTIAILVLLFLALPITIIFPLAFSQTAYLTFPPSGFSLRWMERVLTNPDWLDSLWLSFRISVMSTLLAMVFSLLMALALVRYRFSGKKIIYVLILLPMIVPNIISALALFFFFSDIDVFNSISAIIIGHAIIALPVATIIISSTLQGIDSQLEYSAMSLGAGNFTVFRRITFPLAAPGIISAAIFSFLSSFDELLIALFMAGNSVQTLSVRIWNSVQFELDPTIAAVSVLLVLITIVFLLAANFLTKQR